MIKFTTINTIFTKLQRDFNYTNLNEADVVEWAGEALSAINAVPAMETVTKFFTVTNYQITLPSDIISLNQIIVLKNKDISSVCDCINNLKKKGDINICSADKKIIKNNLGDKECFSTIFVVSDTNWYQNFLYDVVRLSTSTFSSSYDCTDKINTTCKYEYTIINGQYLRFNFTDFSIAISYNRIPLDENGYPLIPDNYSYITAITMYIIYKMALRRFYAGETNSNVQLQKAEIDWNKYCSQAASQAMIPKSIDEMENFAQAWLKPYNARSYYTLFSKQNEIQKLKH